MYIGYGTLSGQEVWNNQRVLDYLAGDPDKGFAGMASPYSTIRRRSSPSKATALFCDPPITSGSFTVQVSTGSLRGSGGPSDFSLWRFISASTLLGTPTALEFINDGALNQIKRFNFSHAEAGGPRPAIPALANSGWSDVGVGAVPTSPTLGGVPTVPSPCANPAVVPYYERWRVRPLGGAEVIQFFIYVDPCLAATDSHCIGVTTNASDAGGADLPSTAQVSQNTFGPDPSGRYSTPQQDDAPWYDPYIPESNDFAGLYVQEVSGFDSLVNRSVNDGALMGGTLGPPSMKVRALTVTGWLRAGTCAGAEYGLHWLTEALSSIDACDGCSVGDLVMLSTAPPENDVSVDPLKYLRIMHHVGLVDGPKVMERSGTCCSECGSTSLKVQFTLTSEFPFIFSDISWILYDEKFTEGPFEYDLSLPCTRAETCSQNKPPIDFGCGPTLPTAPISPPIQDCYCEPWSTMRVGAEFANLRQWNSATTYIEVTAGDADVNNVKLVAFHNPRQEECPIYYEGDDRWMCTTPCASVAISRIPAGGKIVIDSRTRSVNMFLPGGQTISGLRFLSTGDDENPFDWFDIGKCTRLCLVASVEEEGASEARISIGLVNRFLASGG